MKDCFYQYRKGLYDKLRIVKFRGIPVPVMEFAPNEQETPFIQILNMRSEYERDDDNFSQWVMTEIMSVTSHAGPPDDFGSKLADDLTTIVMQKLISKGVTSSDRAKAVTMTDFIDNGAHFEGLRYDNSFDGAVTWVRKILTIRTLIDEKIASEIYKPLTADNTIITVDNDEITVDATVYL
jgi:hypothetical protein